jgi:NADH-quinone oxidoreductase subunit J
MDYALLAATALGAIGLYLLLPRERAPLARLGGLLAAMGLAGFLLYLVRTVSEASPATDGPPVYFYLFAFIMIAGAVGVICQPRPVYAALYFVLVTLAGAGVFVLLMAEFMAIVLIIIYAGAILVTYVFVIMLASQGSTGGVGGTTAPEYDRRANEPFVAVAVSFILIGAVLQVLFPTNNRALATVTRAPDPLMAASFGDVGSAETPLPAATRRARVNTTRTATNPAPTNPVETDVAATVPAATNPATLPDAPVAIAANTPQRTLPATPATLPSNVQVLGVSLYSRYALSLELAGILLTVALVGAVIIARKNTGSMHDALGTGKIPTE